MLRCLFAFMVFSSAVFTNEEIMPSKKEAPYGSWKSPITADLIAKNAIRLSGGKEVNGKLYWSELRPSEKGRTVIVCKTEDGKTEDLLPQPYNARTRVHEYGGGSYLLTQNAIFFSNDQDQQIYRQTPSGEISRLTNEKNSRFADGCYDTTRNLLYYVMEVHGKTVENCLVTIDPKTGTVHKIAQGYDFYSSPRMSPDGRSLAYYCWNLPNMPWDGSELFIAQLHSDGTIEKSRRVAGGENESIARLAWGPDGSLYFVSDQTGWWNLYREKKGKVEALCPMEAEFASPQWVFGQSNFDFWGKDKIACIYSQNGMDHLGILSLSSGKLEKVELPFCYIPSISVSGDHCYLLAGAPNLPQSLIKYDFKEKKWEIVKQSSKVPFSDSFISHPKAIEYRTENGLTAHAFYYPPTNPNFKGMPGELPPLVVHAHGGPTGQTYASFNLATQYLTSRGFAVIDVNYGGSSGYGREYRDRLKRNWGVVDVDDSVNAAMYCVENGLVDPNRLAIEGGSAGGYTTLAAVAFRDVFHVGASYFGVSDLEALNIDTHKFESRYNDQLVGRYPEEKALYIERSPIHHADQIHCPVILLQGDEDAIVPPPQSEKMYQSLLKRGIPTAYLLFKGEQHGFRQEANIKRSIEAAAYFYSKIFGFTLADPIEPVEIHNFHEK